MKKKIYLFIIMILFVITSCNSKKNLETVSVTQTNSKASINTQITKISEQMNPVVDPLEVEYGSKLDKSKIIETIKLSGISNAKFSLDLEENKLPDFKVPGEYKVPLRITYNDESTDDLSLIIKVKNPVSPYSGQEIPVNQLGKPPFFVMIDNHHSARNQASISKASIVWEMRVEGEYTRYMALFENIERKDDFLIGPIRSVRPNFVTIANQYSGILVHHGASPEGSDLVSSLGIKDIDGMYLGGSTFFRYNETGKVAPHNSYSTINNLIKYSNQKNWNENNNYTGFKFNKKFTDIVKGKSATSFEIKYSNGFNDIIYEYDASNKSYIRKREGKIQLDEKTNAKVSPVNIIIQKMDSYPTDELGRRKFNSVGKGSGYYVTGGKFIDIIWEKTDDHTKPTKYYYTDGTELYLNPGMTWIQVIDTDMNPDFK